MSEMNKQELMALKKKRDLAIWILSFAFLAVIGLSLALLFISTRENNLWQKTLVIFLNIVFGFVFIGYFYLSLLPSSRLLSFYKKAELGKGVKEEIKGKVSAISSSLLTVRTFSCYKVEVEDEKKSRSFFLLENVRKEDLKVGELIEAKIFDQICYAYVLKEGEENE
ncbi:MAG: hypothetical protein LKJ88_07420 [Bacilli bacterium]|jgi:hypothetical protein|nr:hypothetical protein [Bacilli bacterium]